MVYQWSTVRSKCQVTVLTQAVVCSYARFVSLLSAKRNCHHVIEWYTKQWRHLYCGTHVPAAYFDVAANTTAIPCTIDVHTPAVLPGYFS